MTVFSDASSDEVSIRNQGPGPVPIGLENARAAAYMDARMGNPGQPGYAPNDGNAGYNGDNMQVADNRPYSGLNDRGRSDRVEDRLQVGAVGKDGQPEPQNPIHTVDHLDRAGNLAGKSEYNYTPNEGTGVKLNGYVDRDAQGNIKEFAVRKPALFRDQKDVYMVFKATPGHPINEEQMRHVEDLLRPDVSPEQRKANQLQLNAERPLADNLQHNMGKQIVALRLDPQTGQRFEVRDMRIDPNTGRQITDHSNPTLCWKGPQGEYFKTPVANLPDFDKQDLANATWHGNMRQPLRFLNELANGQNPQPNYEQMQQRYRNQPGQGYDNQAPYPQNYQDQNPPVLRRR